MAYREDTDDDGDGENADTPKARPSGKRRYIPTTPPPRPVKAPRREPDLEPGLLCNGPCGSYSGRLHLHTTAPTLKIPSAGRGGRLGFGKMDEVFVPSSQAGEVEVDDIRNPFLLPTSGPSTGQLSSNGGLQLHSTAVGHSFVPSSQPYERELEMILNGDKSPLLPHGAGPSAGISGLSIT